MLILNIIIRKITDITAGKFSPDDPNNDKMSVNFIGNLIT